MKLHFAPALLLCATGCSLGPATVVRLVDGQEIDGRPVSETAYAAYAHGALAEARGELPVAERYYTEAVGEDPDSAELWTRLGAVRCARSLPTSDAAFERATIIDADYAPLHREKARCALARDPKVALDEANRAVALDPADDEAARLVIDALERSGRKADAVTWAIARALLLPTPREAWERVKSLAASDPAAGVLADRALAAKRNRRRQVGLASAPPPCSNVDRSALDRALRSNDLETARSLAPTCHLSAGQLAVRAAALGAGTAARRQADLVLAANPSDGDAVVAEIVARDLGGSDDPVPPLELDGMSPPSPLASWLLAEVLLRRVGADAARSWLSARGELDAAREELDQRVEKRVRSALGAGQ